MAATKLQAVPRAGIQAQERQEEGSTAVLPLPRHTGAQEFAEDQAQIEPGDVNQLPFEYILVLAKVRAPHAPGVAIVCETAFDELPAPSQYALAVVTVHSSPAGVHRLLLSSLAISVALSLPLPLRNIGAYLVTLYPLQPRTRVIALVGDHLLDALHVHLRLLARMLFGLPHRKLRHRFAGLA